jgi:methyl-accepting chemotaxis protein-1 (serine sensor receptor)
MNLLAMLKIGPRLTVGFAIILVLMVALAVAGIGGVNKVFAGLKTVYEDRTVALAQLGEVRRGLLRNRAQLSDLLTDAEGARVAQIETEVRANLGLVDTQWKAYLATYLTPDEKTLADALDPALRAFAADAVEPMLAAAKAGNKDKLAALFGTALQPLSAKAELTLDKLVKLQVDVAAQEYESAADTKATLVSSSLALSVVAVAIGALLGWLIRRSIVEPVNRALELARTIASGDLTSDLVVSGRDEMAQLLQEMQTMTVSLRQIVSEVRNSAHSIATGSEEIANGSASLSQRTEQQAANLEETAASMEEMTAAVQQNADTVRTATQLAQHASGVAGKGGSVVGDVVATMADITASASKIADIIGVIDGIAFQTNILALNAAVEAARAGEQGRGFAVVAGEVRVLAKRSADAAKEIKSLIQQSTENVETGSRLVTEAGTTMTEIVDCVKRVADLIAEIGAATAEQSQGITQVGDAVSQLDQVTQQNAALVEESAAAAESLKHQAGSLTQVTSRFRVA